ncbi:MAG: putative Na+/H+ antiporter [Oligoflexia bacterium]|jgi:Na+/H+ antiporter NhaD/arsenite permease-like protein
MTPTLLQLGATLIFGLAILHTFVVSKFQNIAQRYPEGSIGENLFHLLGEVEVVFGFWSAILFAFIAATLSLSEAIAYLEGRNFTEPAFVFVILSICSTKPVLDVASALMRAVAKRIPLPQAVAFYFVLLGFGPLLGSFITEPAIMTVLAILLLKHYYSQPLSLGLKYSTLGLLFVNVSIGGTLTPFAAPPVLMVAGKWGWGLSHMLENFGWKAALACLISTLLVVWRHRRELANLEWNPRASSGHKASPVMLRLIHLVFLAVVVASAHHLVVFAGVFLFFLGLHAVTQEYQEPLKLREGLLVAFFLGGLVVLGGLQSWWLEPVLANLSEFALYLGASALTAITDNAALTYLGSQVPTLTEASKYALVAGSVVGGGLTVIANAPNPAGYGILNGSFGNDGISPIGLFKAALMPTLIAGLAFWIF